MKSQDFSRFFHPLYVLITGVLGGGIVFSMFSPYFPLNCKDGVITFFCVPEFFGMFFLMAILWCMMTIFLVPGWGMLIWLFNRHVAEKDNPHRLQEMAQLLVVVTIIAVSSYIVFQSLNLFNPDTQRRINADLPNGVKLITAINSACLFLVILPNILGMSLVNAVVREISPRIQDADQFKTDLSFSLINDLLTYRKVLQIFLVISGALLSMIPLIVVALRSVLITIDSQLGKIYPVSYVIFEGLIFTLLLLFIYVPAYLELSIVGQQLRDALYPLDSLDDLKDTLEKRKALDNLLQTEISLTSNLKSGILTLGPLVSSLLVLLGIKT